MANLASLSNKSAATVVSPSLAREVWIALPKRNKTLAGITEAIKRTGFDPPTRSTLYRWMEDWRLEPERKLQAAADNEPGVPVAAPKFDKASLDAIPKELQDAVGLRTLFIARGKGLDRVENAICEVADEIAKKAREIATAVMQVESASEATTKGADGEVISTAKVQNNAGEKAIAQLATLATAMREIVSSRVMYSVAFRNYGEGDRLSGEGDKLKAEAQTLIEEGRAGRAKEISGDVAGPYDPSEEDEAVGLLREVEARKK